MFDIDITRVIRICTAIFLGLLLGMLAIAAAAAF